MGRGGSGSAHGAGGPPSPGPLPASGEGGLDGGCVAIVALDTAPVEPEDDVAAPDVATVLVAVSTWGTAGVCDSDPNSDDSDPWLPPEPELATDSDAWLPAEPALATDRDPWLPPEPLPVADRDPWPRSDPRPVGVRDPGANSCGCLAETVTGAAFEVSWARCPAGSARLRSSCSRRDERAASRRGDAGAALSATTMNASAATPTAASTPSRKRVRRERALAPALPARSPRSGALSIELAATGVCHSVSSLQMPLFVTAPVEAASPGHFVALSGVVVGGFGDPPSRG